MCVAICQPILRMIVLYDLFISVYSGHISNDDTLIIKSLSASVILFTFLFFYFIDQSQQKHCSRNTRSIHVTDNKQHYPGEYYEGQIYINVTHSATRFNGHTNREIWFELGTSCWFSESNWYRDYVSLVYILTGFPQGLENRENREKNNGQGKVREKSGNFILGQKSGKSQGILF